MKLNITITDLTPDEAFEVMDKLTGYGNPLIGAPNDTAPALPTHATVAMLTQPAAAPVASSVSNATDSTGLPWDARIHAGSRETKSDGTWKRKRGLQDFEFDSVVAELRNTPVETAPQAPAMPAAPVAPVAPVPQQFTPPAPVAAVAPVPPAAPAMPTRDFQGLMQQVSNLFGAKSITQDYPATIIARVNSGFGVTLSTLTDVASNPQMVEYAWQCLDVDGKGVN